MNQETDCKNYEEAQNFYICLFQREARKLYQSIKPKIIDEIIEIVRTALTSRIKTHEKWDESEEDYVYTYHTKPLTYTDITEICEEIKEKWLKEQENDWI